MQAVTQTASLGDQTLFLSSAPKNTDTSFADIFAKESQSLPTVVSKSEQQTSTSIESKPIPSTETTNTVKADTLVKSTDKVQTKLDEEALKKTASIPAETAIPVVTSLPSIKAKDSLSKVNLTTQWTEIPPVTLRIGGKSITTLNATTTNKVDLSTLAKNIKDLAPLLAKLKDKGTLSSEEQANLIALLTKITETLSTLQTSSTTLSTELKNTITTLTAFKDSLTNSLKGSSASVQALTLQHSTNQSALQTSITQLLQDLQGHVDEVKQSQIFKTEFIKGIDLSQKNSTIQTVTTIKTIASATNEATSLQPTESTSQTPNGGNKSENIVINQSKAPTEKTKTLSTKLLTDTIKPVLNENLNSINFNIDTKVAPQAQPTVAETAPLAGAPQTANIEKQTAILSQITSFMAVTKLRSETEVTLRLHPRELGDIKVQITRNENQALHEPATISAKFQVNSEMVKSVLESNFNLLKDSLQQQGSFNMAQMSVDVQTNGSQNQGSNDNHGSSSGQSFNTKTPFNEEHFVAPPSQSVATHTGDLDQVA